MTGLDEQLELFKLIGRQLKKRTECYVIGGSAMLFYGFKSATKDIDLVFTSEKERRYFADVLKKTGFAPRPYKIKTAMDGYAAAGSPIMLERKETRFDLFLQNIISTKLSPGMAGRIKEKHEFSNLIVNVVSPEDIIVLKCATDRAGDRKDAADIINSREIKWDAILDEARWQAANGKKAFVVLLFDFAEDLRDDYNAGVPRSFAKNLMKEYKEQLIKLLGHKK